MKCPVCGETMLDIHPLEWEIGKICINCGYKEVIEMDWVIKCSNCGRETTIGEINFANGCPKCGQGNFKVIKTPDGKDIKPNEPPK